MAILLLIFSGFMALYYLVKFILSIREDMRDENTPNDLM